MRLSVPRRWTGGRNDGGYRHLLTGVLIYYSPAPWFKRHRDNPQLNGFVNGATAAATGAITGAVIILASRAITDLPTAAIALVSFGVLWRFRIQEPILVVISAVIGLILWPLVRGG